MPDVPAPVGFETFASLFISNWVKEPFREVVLSIIMVEAVWSEISVITVTTMEYIQYNKKRRNIRTTDYL